MNYSDAIEYLNTFTNFEKRGDYAYPESFSLERMKRLAKVLGNPQNAYDSVIIAGSKGKGSTAVLLSSILRMEGLKVGLFTSPHLWDVSERIRVNGLAINETRITEFLSMLKKILDEYSWRKDPPTYFEILTAMAFYHFKEMKIQAAVLEVGLGGLYDATNIAEAKAVGLTPIGLEHTDKLGKTVAKIAVQKCGIIKGREIVVSAPQVREAEPVIAAAAEDRDAELLTVGREIKILSREHGENFQTFDVRSPFGNFFDLKLCLLGEHQIENAAMALCLAKAFEKKTRHTISEKAIRQGILDAQWPGRLEKVHDHPKIVLDGAHTPESIAKLPEALRRHFNFNGLTVLFAVSEDKNVQTMLENILPEIQHFIVTSAGHERSMQTARIAEIAETLGYSEKTTVENDSWKAMEQARAFAGENDLILVTGSLFLVAKISKDIRDKI